QRGRNFGGVPFGLRCQRQGQLFSSWDREIRRNCAVMSIPSCVALSSPTRTRWMNRLTATRDAGVQLPSVGLNRLVRKNPPGKRNNSATESKSFIFLMYL